MWELAKVQETEVQQVEGYLRQGFTPFAVSQDSWGITTIWMKKEVKELETTGTTRRKRLNTDTSVPSKEDS